MDAPPEKTPVDPSDETHGRPLRNHETRLSNALESNMISPLTIGQQYGDFKIRGFLGRGKAGFVYSAIDSLSKSRCALKLLCRMTPQDLYRNKLGFRRMSSFRHPCLMRTDRIEVIDKQTLLSMEEIEGDTLYATVRDFASIDPQVAFEKLRLLLHDYAVGLSVMHLSGLVHRDLKPTNLMVRSEGRGVIVDYGLVANCDPELDPYGLRPYIAGTPRYFSPEALWEQSYTPAGDVFSLGLVMLDCLSQVSGSDQWLRQGEFADWVREEDEQTIADAVSSMNRDIPPLLRMLVAGMLSADRTKRPSSLEIVEMTKIDDMPVRLKTTHNLFGRESELEQCDQWILQVYRGHTGRLHLHGEAGAGKTRLLDELERRLRQYKWGQVFRVKCRSRENQSLQVLDQIADQIAQRYSRSDRDQLKLDPVSASILVHSFPQLRHVIESDLKRFPDFGGERPKRLDALSAALRLSRELRKVGPLIIIIDDAQWSDHDSDTVWDEIQNDSEGFLGIITSSRQHETNQRHAADRRIYIGPLPKTAAFSFLHAAARRWKANINSAGLDELVEVSRCNAFRLQELAEEFRPGGMLHEVEQSSDASISNLGDVDRFWRARFDRLSDDAKSILAHIVTAGAPVSFAQLDDLTGLGDHVDVAVFELVNQRLVNDDATGKECITVVHDKIADGLIENIDHDEVRLSHLAWAALLTRMNRPRDYAARIAEHYYAADQEGAALPFAIMAAANADRAFAKSEAGRWHEKVLTQVTGDARDKHLRDAARCFHEADLPEKAAQYYLLLAEQSEDPIELLGFRTQAIQLLLRSGQIDRARPLLAEHLNSLGIRIAEGAFANVRAYDQRFGNLACELSQRWQDTAASLRQPTSEGDRVEHQDRVGELAFCSEISRSLSMLDLKTTMDVILHGSDCAHEHGTPQERLHFATMAGVWRALLCGGRAGVFDDCRRLLADSLKRLRNQPAGKATAEIRSGMAFIEALAMRWCAVPETVDASVIDFIADEEPMRFEIAHTRWLRLWADWHLGRWKDMGAMAEEMIQDASRRNDSYQQLMATTGFGGNALLYSDDVDRLQRLGDQNARVGTDTGTIELVQFFHWLQTVQQSLYLADYRSAADMVVTMRREIRTSMIRRIPFVLVSLDYLTALTSLHLHFNQQDAETARRANGKQADAVNLIGHGDVVRNCVRRLLKRRSEFSVMLGNLVRGLDDRLGDPADSIEMLQRAREAADRQGLLPYRLAAEDAIERLEDPHAEIEGLRHYMLGEGVARPERFERLYTVRRNEPS